MRVDISPSKDDFMKLILLTSLLGFVLEFRRVGGGSAFPGNAFDEVEGMLRYSHSFSVGRNSIGI